MTTIATLYGRFCHSLLEGGSALTLGLWTEAQFLDLYASKATDFLNQTGIIQRVWIGLAELGVPKYTLPDWAVEPLHVFYNERALTRTALGSAEEMNPGWMGDLSGPQAWRNDKVGVREIEVLPPPNREGRQITDPSGVTRVDEVDAAEAQPSAFYGDISGEPERVFYGTDGGPIYISRSNLAVIATASLADSSAPESGDSVALIPDSFVHYVLYGMLATVFSQDGELKDVMRAQYCEARYKEGINIAKAIMESEVMGNG